MYEGNFVLDPTGRPCFVDFETMELLPGPFAVYTLKTSGKPFVRNVADHLRVWTSSDLVPMQKLRRYLPRTSIRRSVRPPNLQTRPMLTMATGLNEKDGKKPVDSADVEYRPSFFLSICLINVPVYFKLATTELLGDVPSNELQSFFVAFLTQSIF